MRRKVQKRQPKQTTTYNPQVIEKKWQKIWGRSEIFKAKNKSRRGKFYCLDMFPYPSAEGLHVGHPRGYIASDIISHFMRMKGCNILHPMGWDAFGLPAENYAIRTGVHPETSTKKNIKRMKEQIRSVGFSYDWSREINTTDPEYYRWTQWIFLLLYKRGLTYEAVLPINWCPSCKTGLANEEVINGSCERCGTEVTKKNLRQWVLKITAYADRLLKDLNKLDWPEKIKEMQRNWIGKSEGGLIKFHIPAFKVQIDVFTTRVDTLFGATYLVLAPEHPIINDLGPKISNFQEVKEYIENSQKKTERERISEAKEKTGTELKGIKAINPVNNKKIPIFVADYVLSHYGTGAIMAVPAHDERDFEFAKKYKLPIIEVIKPQEILAHPFQRSTGIWGKSDVDLESECWTGEGTLINSGRFDGMKSGEARNEITKWLSKKRLAKQAVNFKLRDWVFSRQRYWGEPIPVIHCKKCGIVPLNEKDLPLKLPKIKKYQPTGTGKSPLAAIREWVNTNCPKCSGPAERETNTMPQWAGSCWYFLRYVDPKNRKQPFSKKKVKYWLPVDLYIGGAEHAVLHLLYSRFWIKVLYDEGLIDFDEPFLKLRNQGLILAPDGQKMSKSRGNVVSPDDIIKKYGADTLRLYEMFMGPFNQSISWDIKGIIGMRRFLEEIWKLGKENLKGESSIYKESDKDIKEHIKDKIKLTHEKAKRLIHKTIKKVTEDIEKFKFNTAISQLMILVKECGKYIKLDKDYYSRFLILLAPFAPHISEELWNQELGNKNSIFMEEWPRYNKNLIEEKRIPLIVCINGKQRDEIDVEKNAPKKKVEQLTFKREKVKKYTSRKKIKKIIFIRRENYLLINIVV